MITLFLLLQHMNCGLNKFCGSWTRWEKSSSADMWVAQIQTRFVLAGHHQQLQLHFFSKL